MKSTFEKSGKGGTFKKAGGKGGGGKGEPKVPFAIYLLKLINLSR